MQLLDFPAAMCNGEKDPQRVGWGAVPIPATEVRGERDGRGRARDTKTLTGTASQSMHLILRRHNALLQ